MASQKALDSKHEKILKELSRKSDNKRCANCDTTGPSYVVTNFNTFVCTVCGGIHRQFGHRVKGITMATFKPDEIQALQDGGNEKCLQLYLAKWTPRDLAKPTDRIPHKIKDWIEAVYVKKRYFSPDGAKLAEVVQTTAQAHAEPVKKPDVAVRVVSRAGSIASGGGSFSLPASSQVVEHKSVPPAAFDPFADPVGQPASNATEAAWANFSAPVVQTPDAAAHQPATDFFANSGLPTASTAASNQQPAWEAFPAQGAVAAPTPAAATPASPATTGWTSFDNKPTSAPVAAPAQTQPAQAGWQAFGDTASPAAAPVEEAKKPPPPELPLELFSEVASLGLAPQPGRAPGQAPPGRAVPGFGPGVQQSGGFAYGTQPSYNTSYSSQGPSYNQSGTFAPANNSVGFQTNGSYGQHSYQQNQSSNYNSSFTSNPSGMNYGNQATGLGGSFTAPAPNNASFTSNFSGSHLGNSFGQTFSNGQQSSATQFGQNFSGGFSSVSSPVASSVDAFGNVTNVNASYTSHKSEPGPDAFSDLAPGFKSGVPHARASLPSSFVPSNFTGGQPAASVQAFNAPFPQPALTADFNAPFPQPAPTDDFGFGNDFGMGAPQQAPSKSGNPFA